MEPGFIEQPLQGRIAVFRATGWKFVLMLNEDS
jgi:hypothetical protein